MVVVASSNTEVLDALNFDCTTVENSEKFERGCVGDGDTLNYFTLRHAYDLRHNLEDSVRRYPEGSSVLLNTHFDELRRLFPNVCSRGKGLLWMQEFRRALYDTRDIFSADAHHKADEGQTQEAIRKLLAALSQQNDRVDELEIARNVFRIRFFSLAYGNLNGLDDNSVDRLMGDIEQYATSARPEDLDRPEKLTVCSIALRSLWRRSELDGRWPIHHLLFLCAIETSGANIPTDNARQGLAHMIRVVESNGYTEQFLDTVSSLAFLTPEYKTKHDLREETATYMRRFFTNLSVVQLKGEVGVLVSQYVRFITLFPPCDATLLRKFEEVAEIMTNIEANFPNIQNLRKRKRHYLSLQERACRSTLATRARVMCTFVVALNQRSTLQRGFTVDIETALSSTSDFIEAFKKTRLYKIHELHIQIMRTDEEDAYGHTSPMLGAPKSHISTLMHMQQLESINVNHTEVAFHNAVDKYIDALRLMQAAKSAEYSSSSVYWNEFLQFACDNMHYFRRPGESQINILHFSSLFKSVGRMRIRGIST
ncbi:hypothetical protein CYMTET_3676 [Cymbomonas tetramitiformis]|uniref:Uncharacterized protein n=1 Tax=Cymbomonas tetramitiformis TaxID=36881 RepID=A0AAE0H2U9_9CHLO|nr:hypothetical protein CYMTET_3676 [Cymbomonas tetramitiformis]